MTTSQAPTIDVPRPYVLAHALAYAAHGWPVLPLAPSEKRPAGELVPRGFTQATTDPATIAQWFALVPDAGVGIHPGPAGLLVLDLDNKPGKPRGADALATLEAVHGELPATLTQRTPGGGEARHLVFSLPEGIDPARIGNATLAPGIDVRCSAGYIAAEPTRLPAGAYAFDDWDALTGEIPEIAQAPAWLLRLLTEPAGAVPVQATADAPEPTGAREFATPLQVTELRSALNALDADDYATWIACGHALRGLGDVGRELWLSWSQQSEKWQPADVRRWDGFAADHAGFRCIFARAHTAGWVNPASKAAALPAAAVASSGEHAQAPARPPWRAFDAADLAAQEVPPQRWVWAGYIPAGEMTLLSAHGGSGKSYIALMLAVSVAVGVPLFGVDTDPARVVFFSGEDGRDTVARRLQVILQALGIPAESLRGRLLILDATDAPELVGVQFVDGVQRVGLTMTGAALAGELAELPAPLLIVDNASDTFGGNEIARAEVRAFVRELVRMVKSQGGAVCLLAHVDKNTAKGFGGAQSYSGSTAWHNSARSRLALRRESDGGALVIEHEKNNHDALREPLRLVWPRDGVPMLDAPTSGIVHAIATDNHTRALLRLVHEFTQRGEFVSTATTSRTHAGKLLRLAPGFPPRLTDGNVFELLRDAERRGWVARVTYKGGDRHQRERWEVTTAGIEEAGISDGAVTAVTAATSEVPALAAVAASPCGDCGDLPRGVWGETAPQEVPKRVPA